MACAGRVRKLAKINKTSNNKNAGIPPFFLVGKFGVEYAGRVEKTDVEITKYINEYIPQVVHTCINEYTHGYEYMNRYIFHRWYIDV